MAFNKLHPNAGSTRGGKGKLYALASKATSSVEARAYADNTFRGVVPSSGINYTLTAEVGLESSFSLNTYTTGIRLVHSRYGSAPNVQSSNNGQYASDVSSIDINDLSPYKANEKSFIVLQIAVQDVLSRNIQYNVSASFTVFTTSFSYLDSGNFSLVLSDATDFTTAYYVLTAWIPSIAVNYFTTANVIITDADANPCDSDVTAVVASSSFRAINSTEPVIATAIESITLADGGFIQLAPAVVPSSSSANSMAMLMVGNIGTTTNEIWGDGYRNNPDAFVATAAISYANPTAEVLYAISNPEAISYDLKVLKTEILAEALENAVVSYNLATATGVFGLAGTPAPVRYARKMPTVSGFRLLTGSSVGLLKGIKVLSVNRSYSLTGQNVNFNNNKLIAESQSFALTGQAAGLRKTILLRSNTANFTIGGSVVRTLYGRKQVSASKAYTLTGQVVGLSARSPLPTETYGFTLTGQAVLIKKANVLTVNTRAYTLTGSDTTNKVGRKLRVFSGYFAFSEDDIPFVKTSILTTDTASYALSYNNINLVKVTQIVSDTAVYTITPSQVGVRRVGDGTYTIFNEVSNYTLAGQPTTRSKGTIQLAASKQYFVSSPQRKVLKGYEITAESAGFTLTGVNKAIEVASTVVWSVESGTFTLTRTDAGLVGPKWLPLGNGVFNLSMYGLLLKPVVRITSQSINYTVISPDIGMLYSGVAHYVKDAPSKSYVLTGSPVVMAVPKVMLASNKEYYINRQPFIISTEPVNSVRTIRRGNHISGGSINV